MENFNEQPINPYFELKSSLETLRVLANSYTKLNASRGNDKSFCNIISQSVSAILHNLDQNTYAKSTVKKHLETIHKYIDIVMDDYTRSTLQESYSIILSQFESYENYLVALKSKTEHQRRNKKSKWKPKKL